jgi:hypothetical protein
MVAATCVFRVVAAALLASALFVAFGAAAQQPQETKLTPEMHNVIGLFQSWLGAEYDRRLAQATGDWRRQNPAQNEASRLRSEYNRAFHELQSSCPPIQEKLYRNQPVEWAEQAIAKALNAMTVPANNKVSGADFRHDYLRPIRNEFQMALAEVCLKHAPEGPQQEFGILRVPAGARVQIGRTGGTEEVVGPRDARLSWGDQVRNASSAEVLAIWQVDGVHLRVKAHTTVQFNRDNIFIRQDGGVWVSVRKAGSRFMVNTENAGSAVRGTEFSVAYEGAKRATRVSVTEGQVDVRNRAGGPSLTLGPGQSAEVVGDRPPARLGVPAGRNLSGLWRVKVPGSADTGGAVLFQENQDLYLSVVMPAGGRNVVWNGRTTIAGGRADGVYWLTDAAPAGWPRGGAFGDGKLALALSPRGDAITGTMRGETGGWSASVTLERVE